MQDEVALIIRLRLFGGYLLLIKLAAAMTEL
jgi:hypothetical protein